jgi:triosephosphate isomerase
MVGHAERVAAGETLEHFAEQVARARDVGLAVLLCVGESVMGADSGEGLVMQAEVALRGVLEDEDVVAYEPHWAIGEAGRQAPADYVSERLERLRDALGSQATIVYGGSVNPGNCAALAGISGNSGIFVGRAAWTPEGWDELESRVKGAMT